MRKTSLCALSIVAALGASVAAGCGDGDDDDADTDATQDDASGDDSSGNVDDMNDSFDEAAELPVGTDVDGVIQRPADSDYYTFDAAAGDWVMLYTTANVEDEPTKVDTVIRLYDADHVRIAENDDALPRLNPDSELIYRVPAAGTYYVEVLEYSTWAGEPPAGNPTFTYALMRQTITEQPGFGIDPESGDTAAEAKPVTFATDSATYILGTFEDANDVDFFSFTVPGTAVVNLSAMVMPHGNTAGHGSTASAGVVAIDDATAGDPVLARIDYVAGPEELGPSVAGGTPLLLSIAHPTGAVPGANPFYVVKLSLFGELPLEAEEATNGAAAGAEALDQGSGSGIILARLPTNDDVDYFSFNASMGQEISVFCLSRRNGSGVQGLHVEVRGPNDVTLLGATRDEVLTSDLFLEGLSVQTTGAHYLRLSKTGQDPGISGDFVRCVAGVRDPG